MDLVLEQSVLVVTFHPRETAGAVALMFLSPRIRDGCRDDETMILRPASGRGARGPSLGVSQPGLSAKGGRIVALADEIESGAERSNLQ